MEPEVIEINPERTERSPITEIFKCQVTLYKDFIEADVHYTFTDTYEDDMGVPRIDTGVRKFRTTMRKSLIDVDRTTNYRTDDQDLEHGLDVVIIRSAAGFEGTIDMTAEDADKLYEAIKTWMMS